MGKYSSYYSSTSVVYYSRQTSTKLHIGSKYVLWYRVTSDYTTDISTYVVAPGGVSITDYGHKTTEHTTYTPK